MRLYDYKGGKYTLHELENKQQSYLDTMENIPNKAKAEKRSLTSTEAADFENLQRKFDDLNNFIKKITTPVNTPLYSNPSGKTGRGFKSLGEQLSAVALAGIPGGSVDQRLFNAATGMSSVPSDGGFLIAPEFTTELLRRTYETAILAPRCKTWEVGENSDGLEIPYVDEKSRATGSRWGGVRVYRLAEADTVNASKPKLGRMEIRLEDMMGICYATERLLRDATALESFITDAFTEEFAFMVDDEIIRGTGVGQCLGILNSPALVAVTKENGQAANSVLAENIMKMWSRMWARSRPNAVWYINQDIEIQLHSLSLSVGTGGVPVYMPAGGLSQSPFATLYGRPVIPIEQCETLGTKGDIILADMSQYLLVKKADIQSAASIHVRFIYNERAFRFILSINGQPKWQSALTPYKGSNTLSPFVALETRN